MSVSLIPDLPPAEVRFVAQLNRGNPGAGTGKSGAEFAQVLTELAQVAEPLVTVIPNPALAPTAPVLPGPGRLPAAPETDLDARVDLEAEALPGQLDPQKLTSPQLEFWPPDAAAAMVGMRPDTGPAAPMSAPLSGPVGPSPLLHAALTPPPGTTFGAIAAISEHQSATQPVLPTVRADIHPAQAPDRGDRAIGQTMGRATDPSSEIPVSLVPGSARLPAEKLAFTHTAASGAVRTQPSPPAAPPPVTAAQPATGAKPAVSATPVVRTGLAPEPSLATRFPTQKVQVGPFDPDLNAVPRTMAAGTTSPNLPAGSGPTPVTTGPHHSQSMPISPAIPPHGQPSARSSPAPPLQTAPLTKAGQTLPTMPTRATYGTLMSQTPTPATLPPRVLHRPHSGTAASGPPTSVPPNLPGPKPPASTSPPITQTATAPPPRTGVEPLTDKTAKPAQTLGHTPQAGSRPDGFIMPQHMLISALQALPQPAPDSRAMAAHIATQLAQAGRAQPSGSTDIVLNPRELGQVRLNLQVLDGAISVTIIAERPETADLMRRHIDALTQEFRSLGYQDVTISFGGRQGSRDDGPAQQFQSGTRQDDPARDSKSGPAATQTPDPTTDSTLPRPAATRTGRGGLDLRL